MGTRRTLKCSRDGRKATPAVSSSWINPLSLDEVSSDGLFKRHFPRLTKITTRVLLSPGGGQANCNRWDLKEPRDEK